MKELDERGNADNDKALKKRLITYDSKGDIIFIKNLKADALPNPLLTPPYKIRLNKHGTRGESQMSSYTHSNAQPTLLPQEEQQSKKKAYIKGEKVALLAHLEGNHIKNEIVPMGSVFNEVEPNEGIKIGEAGKYKYGNMNLSKKNIGQMSLEEYKQQKEFAVI